MSCESVSKEVGAIERLLKWGEQRGVRHHAAIRFKPEGGASFNVGLLSRISVLFQCSHVLLMFSSLGFGVQLPFDMSRALSTVPLC